MSNNFIPRSTKENYSYIVTYDSGEYSSRYIKILGVFSNLIDGSIYITKKLLPELINGLQQLDKSNYHSCNPFDIFSDYYIQVFQIDQPDQENIVLNLDPSVFSNICLFPDFIKICDHSYNAQREIKYLSANLEHDIFSILQNQQQRLIILLER